VNDKITAEAIVTRLAAKKKAMHQGEANSGAIPKQIVGGDENASRLVDM
jgi:hypothetical protein